MAKKAIGEHYAKSITIDYQLGDEGADANPMEPPTPEARPTAATQTEGPVRRARSSVPTHHQGSPAEAGAATTSQEGTRSHCQMSAGDS